MPKEKDDFEPADESGDFDFDANEAKADELKDVVAGKQHLSKMGLKQEPSDDPESGSKVDDGSGFDLEDYRMDDDEVVEIPDEEEVEKLEEKAEIKPTEEVSGDYTKIRDDILQVVGEDTVLKIKGQDVRAGDLTPEELVVVLQKGIHSDRTFQENASVRKELEQRQASVEQGARIVQDMMSRYGTPEDKKPILPKELQVNEYDDEQVKGLKGIIGELHTQVNQLSQTTEDADSRQREGQIVSEINTLSKNYPQASIDEVIAIKAMRPDLNTEDVMRTSHDHYISKKFIIGALESNPELKREIKQAYIKEYALERGKAKKVDQRRVRSSGGTKVSTKPKRIAKNYDFASADELAEEYLAGVGETE